MVNLSNDQNFEMLKKIEAILPNNCSIQDSITSSRIIIPTKIMNNININNIKCNILNYISSDVLLKMLNYLSFNDLINLEQSCRYFYIECHHPKALYTVSYSFDNENNYFNPYLNNKYLNNKYLNNNNNNSSFIDYTHSRFSNIEKLSLSHEYGEFDQEITNKQFNKLWLKNVNQLNCLFATEFIDSCNFNQYLKLKSFYFENISKLTINLAGQHGLNWLNLILNDIVNAHLLRELHLTHILESVDLMKIILKCNNLEKLFIKNLDFPTLRYYDDSEYYEFFEREYIELPKLKEISYIDTESFQSVGINEWLKFIGYLIKNIDIDGNKINLYLSFRCQINKYDIKESQLNILFDNNLNEKEVICKINNLIIDIDDAMVNCIKYLADKLLQYNHTLNTLKISGMIIKNRLNLDVLYQKFKILFAKAHKTRLLFCDFYQNDSIRMSMTNPLFLSWVQKLLKLSNNVNIDFKSRI